MSRAKRKRIAALHRKQRKRARRLIVDVVTSSPFMAAVSMYCFHTTRQLFLGSAAMREATRGMPPPEGQRKKLLAAFARIKAAGKR